MRTRFLFLTVLALWSAAPAGAFTLSKFDTPESFVSDPEDGTYYVSNLNGTPLGRDGNGYITKISADGKIVIQKFIGGKPKGPVLHSPKGLAIAGRTLYVADIDSVKGFDKHTHKYTALVDLSGRDAKFLNDLAYDGSRFLYASDMLSNRIFRIDLAKNHEAAVFAEGPMLGNPNGLVVNPKTKNLMAVTWSGHVLEIDRTGRPHALKRGLSTLDGVDYDSAGNLYVSNFDKGEIYKIPHFGRGPVTTLLTGLTGPSDISFDRRRGELLIPSFTGNKVATYREKPVTSAKK